MIHALSEARGELVQGITGIPWYYRLFGYEMALDMEAEQVIDGMHITELKKGEVETCRLRQRTDADNAFIQDTYAHAIESQVFACPRSPALWEYEFNGRSAGSDARHNGYSSKIWKGHDSDMYSIISGATRISLSCGWS